MAEASVKRTVAELHRLYLRKKEGAMIIALQGDYSTAQRQMAKANILAQEILGNPWEGVTINPTK